jgi:peptidoglycan hydrolase-like protein with peptidoglycan-binding domain
VAANGIIVRGTILTAIVVGLLYLALPVGAHAQGTPGTAALQVALRAHGFYQGPIDGVRGSATVAALEAFQRRNGLAVTGRPNQRTHAALGKLGRPRAGARGPHRGAVGWDVAWLEFRLATRGFSPGRIDGRYDGDTDTAVQAFLRSARLGHHCHVGRRVFSALRRAKAARTGVALTWPLEERLLLRSYGIRGNRLHPGVTIAGQFGAGVAAAGSGRVVFADWQPGPNGLVVVLKHRRDTFTMYGHLARIDVRVGQRIPRGAFLGLVGRTGRTRSAALYFEVRVRGATVDPIRALR